MAKDIIIQESGADTSLSNIDKLRTKQLGGGTVNWVPEDETQRADLTVAENGTYMASDDGYYCYGNVTVDVAGGGGKWVSGTAPDGNDYIFEFDDSTGEVTQELLPSSIEITTPPTKLEYYEGGQIDFTGIVVTAYDGNGNAWDVDGYQGGIIPFGELQFPTTTAHADGGESNIYENSSAEIEVDGSVISGPVSYVEAISTLYGEGGTQIGIDTADGSPVVIETSREEATFRITELFDTAYNKHALLVTMDGSSSPGSVRIGSKSVGATMNVSSTMSIDGKTVIYTSIDVDSVQRFSTSTNSGSLNHNLIGKLAWFLWNGDGFTPKGNQSVPVNWPRYGDSEILTDSFSIEVHAHDGWGDDTGDGGSTSGGDF